MKPLGGSGKSGKSSRPLRILLTGGGTGGHIYPALSIAAAVRERIPAAELLYIGTADGLEADLVPRAGVPFAVIAARGLVGKGPAGKVMGLGSLLRGTGQAFRAVGRFRPHVAVGTGGYVSGPVVTAAVLHGIPVALQEQNVVPGVTNRFLSRFARFVSVAYEESRPYFPGRAPVVVTGNPVRPEVLRADRAAARRALGLGAGEILVLIFMGSRGSATVNRAVTEALPLLRRRPGLRVIFAAGDAHFDAVLRQATALGLPVKADRLGSVGARRAKAGDAIDIHAYIHDMVPVLAAADLAVTRAGAITLAEVAVRGLPAVLIPSPYVTHHHQERNAAVVEGHGAARVLAEAGLDGAALASAVRSLVDDREGLGRMAERSRRLGRPGALDDIVKGILDLALVRGGGR